jgi:hypothetical protein
LELRGNLEFRFGNYRDKPFTCSACARPNYLSNEKQTDVNIAVEMMVDAYEDNFDIAVVVSGDSDLVPPIKAIKGLFPHKKILACFPPRRRSKEIRRECGGGIVIGETDLKHSQLPKEFGVPMATSTLALRNGNKPATLIRTLPSDL